MMNPIIKEAIKEAKLHIKFLKKLLKDFDSEWEWEQYSIISNRIHTLEMQIKAARRIKR